MSALSDLMANVIEPGGIMPGRPEGDVTAPGQKAMPTSTGVQTSPPATGNLPPGVIQYDVPGAGYRPGRGPLITAAQLGKWFGG
jgi:hypothetical protein